MSCADEAASCSPTSRRSRQTPLSEPADATQRTSRACQRGNPVAEGSRANPISHISVVFKTILMHRGSHSGIVNDPANRTQIEMGIAVLAPPEPGRPRRLLSLGEVKWGQVMTTQHTARLARARDLLAASFDISDCALACYSAAGFSADLRSATGPGLLLVSSGDLYG
jgi:hypothetical protein